MARKDIPDVMVVRAAFDRQANPIQRGFVNELLAARTGQPLKVCDRAIERAMARKLVECGVSERTCWPTSAGLALLSSSRNADRSECHGTSP